MSIWTQRVSHYSSEAGHAAGTKHIRSLQTVLLPVEFELGRPSGAEPGRGDMIFGKNW